MVKKVWRIVQVLAEDARLIDLEEDGWEPFAVTHEANELSRWAYRVWLRKLVSWELPSEVE
jgi:hypothetical protein